MRTDYFKEIPGASKYQIFQDGRVLSMSTNWRGYGERELIATPNSNGYLRVRVMMDSGHRKSLMIHRLVTELWHGPRPSPRHEVRHLNGVRTDNWATNLRWGTRLENAADRERHGRTARGNRNSASKLLYGDVQRIRFFYKQGITQRELAALFHVSRKTIENIIHNVYRQTA